MMPKDCNMPKPGGAKFSVSYLPLHRSYVVRDPEGRVCSGPTCKDNAEKQRDAKQLAADRKSKVGPRPCLRCRTEFKSEGIHNRLCPRCRGIGSAEGMSNPYSMGAMTGRRKSA